MTPQSIIEAKRDIKAIREFAVPGANEKYLKENPQIDKHGYGFNIDGRFDAAGKHTVSYDSWLGKYGNSGSSTWLDISSKELFWKCFDAFLNRHQDTILAGVADLMAAEVKKNVDELQKKIDELNKTIEEIENM